MKHVNPVERGYAAEFHEQSAFPPAGNKMWEGGGPRIEEESDASSMKLK